MSSEVNGKEDIARVASISANNEEIGILIADAMEKVSKDGVITIEESKTSTTEVSVVEGMQFDKGYVSPYMVTDTEKMEVVMDNPYILITDKKLVNIQEILPILEEISSQSGKLVIIADDFENEALSTLILNKLSFSGTVSIEVCHCEERSDVAISWYNLSYRSAFFNVVPGDCHVGLTTSSQ